MQTVRIRYTILIAIACFSIALSAQNPDAATRDAFEKRALSYSETLRGIDQQIPAISKEATAEQIGARKVVPAKRAKEARANAKHGDIFTADAIAMIRRIIAAEFPGTQLADLRKAVVEAETKGVPIKVNAEYPEAKEKLEMPPQLLIALPQLPDELRYRFVGKNLLLVDKESGLILDYMTNAIP